MNLIATVTSVVVGRNFLIKKKYENIFMEKFCNLYPDLQDKICKSLRKQISPLFFTSALHFNFNLMTLFRFKPYLSLWLTLGE